MLEEVVDVCSIGLPVSIKGTQETRISDSHLNVLKRRVRLAISLASEHFDTNAMTPPFNLVKQGAGQA